MTIANRTFGHLVIAMIRLSNDDLHRILFSASRATILMAALSLCGGCGMLGNATIVSARTPVNEAVATTARQQTLMNIVRVYHNESPVILDIAETDDAVAVGGSATGGVVGFGSPVGSTTGQTGSVSGTMSVADAITNRYLPLQGQALISQLSSQIKVETLNALYDSQWPLQSILEFAVDRLSPDKEDFRLAEDLLTQLDANNSISIATAKSIFSMGKKNDHQNRKFGNLIIQQQDSASTGGDTLNIYLTQEKTRSTDVYNRYSNRDIWRHLYRVYDHSQPDKNGNFYNDIKGAPNIIELRNSPITDLSGISDDGFRSAYLGPVMRTRTAIGILKYIVRQPKVAFIGRDEYEKIMQYSWNSKDYFKKCPEADSYTLSPSNFVGHQHDDKELYFDQDADLQKYEVDLNAFLLQVVSKSIESTKKDERPSCIYSFPLYYNNSLMETSLSALRRFIIVVVSRNPISDAFTSWNDGESFFSIMPDDRISQRNLMLVSQLLTIQATSTPSAALTTISASGR